jgi:peroxiredoxin
MRTANLVGGPLLALLTSSVAASAYGQTSNLPPRSEVPGPQERLASLVKAHQDARGRFFEEYKATADDGEVKRALSRYRAEIDRTAKEAMHLARTHAQEPVAIDALRFVVKAGQAGQMGDPRRNSDSVEALDILCRNHALAPKMGEFCETIVLTPHDPVAESLIRQVLDRHPSRDDRGYACHALAVLLRFQAQEIRWLKGKPEDRKPFEEHFGDALKSFEDVWGQELMASFLKRDPKALDTEADSLLRRVITEFGDVPHAVGTKARTLADLAAAELLERYGLAVGKSAPNIEGKDPDGKTFKLSDYRGQVVMLTFSGNWCGPCRAMYPKERELVERFKGKPFALLSVNTDEEVETLRKSIETGEITWRCWWDGRTGPITERWGVMQFPAIFLLDDDGVIRAKPHHQSDTLAKMVEDLLDECKAKSKR